VPRVNACSVTRAFVLRVCDIVVSSTCENVLMNELLLTIVPLAEKISKKSEVVNWRPLLTFRRVDV
jgi:hypothetical protein